MGLLDSGKKVKDNSVIVPTTTKKQEKKQAKRRKASSSELHVSSRVSAKIQPRSVYEWQVVFCCTYYARLKKKEKKLTEALFYLFNLWQSLIYVFLTVIRNVCRPCAIW